MIIAIDGPAGSGKSTIAKKVAEQLEFTFLDTGAMYRMVTLYNLVDSQKLEDEQTIIQSLNKINIKVVKNHFYLNNQLVDKEIRMDKVSRNVSYVAAIKEVRNYLVSLQREIAKNNNCILDGRDIASVVFPNADYKFYLNASITERANRRFKEQDKQSLEEIKQDIKNRDMYDMTRKESPLIKVADAVEIDTSNLSINQVCKLILAEVKK